MSDTTPDNETEAADEDDAHEPVSPMSHRRCLADMGYRGTVSECQEESCEGYLWYDDHTLVCALCWTVIDMDYQRRTVSIGDPWAEFWENRPTYRGSQKGRVPGGFGHSYEWDSGESSGVFDFYR